MAGAGRLEQLVEVCAANHLWRQDHEVRAARCCSYGKQLLGGTMGFVGPQENESTGLFFLGMLFSANYYRS